MSKSTEPVEYPDEEYVYDCWDAGNNLWTIWNNWPHLTVAGADDGWIEFADSATHRMWRLAVPRLRVEVVENPYGLALRIDNG